MSAPISDLDEVVRLADAFDYESICEEASKRFRWYCMGVRGQTITECDGLDYWTALVAHERMSACIRQHHAAIRRAFEDADRWRPIESAPRDGTSVLLSQRYLRDEPFIGSWFGGGWEPDTRCYDTNGNAIVEGNIGLQENIDFWMPLPEPPTAPKLPCSSGPETELNLGADAKESD